MLTAFLVGLAAPSALLIGALAGSFWDPLKKLGKESDPLPSLTEPRLLLPEHLFYALG